MIVVDNVVVLLAPASEFVAALPRNRVTAFSHRSALLERGPVPLDHAIEGGELGSMALVAARVWVVQRGGRQAHEERLSNGRAERERRRISASRA